MVGCHHGVIAGNTFADMPGSAVQTKGGSSDVLIHGNRFLRVGQRAIISAGTRARPISGARLDARSGADPRDRQRHRGHRRHAGGVQRLSRLRVRQQHDRRSRRLRGTDRRGERDSRTRRARLVRQQPDRVRARRLRGFVDVRDGARSATFTFGWNLWHARDDAGFRGPRYGGGLPPEQNPIVGRDPGLDARRRPGPAAPHSAPGTPCRADCPAILTAGPMPSRPRSCLFGPRRGDVWHTLAANCDRGPRSVGRISPRIRALRLPGGASRPRYTIETLPHAFDGKPLMQNDTAASTEHAPINWVTTILFTATPLAALVFVPWYGIAHGYSTAAWLSFVFFLWACGISITAATTGSGRTAPTRPTGRSACSSCCSARWRCRTASSSGPRSTARTTASWTTWTRILQREAGLLVLAHGLDPA